MNRRYNRQKYKTVEKLIGGNLWMAEYRNKGAWYVYRNAEFITHVSWLNAETGHGAIEWVMTYHPKGKA
jgi:hypothetical protein